MAYKGRYKPQNPQKYTGDPHNIIYRSLWERKFMVYCDTSDAILEWGSEEIIIPYLSPWDGRIHRYFPDFYIKVRQADNSVRECKTEHSSELSEIFFETLDAVSYTHLTLPTQA